MDRSLPVLYLDYDGVLHPYPVYLTQDRTPELSAPGHLFMHVPVLQRLLVPYAQRLPIVLSTSWVVYLGYEQTLAYLPESLRRLVIGATLQPEQEEFDALTWRRLSRYQQIVQHAERNGIKRWLALDDNHDCWPEEQYGHLVLCNNMRGLGARSTQLQLVNRLRELLS